MYTMLNYPIGSTVLAYDCFTTLFTYISLNTIYHDDDDDGDDAYITIGDYLLEVKYEYSRWVEVEIVTSTSAGCTIPKLEN